MPELIVTRRNGDKHTIRYDADDAHLIEPHAWSIKVDATPGLFYAVSAIGEPAGNGRRRLVKMHHLVAGKGVDHISGDGLDNRRANLRPASGTQNNANRRKGGQVMHSAYKGVTWRKKGRKWMAQICVDRKRRYLGLFSTEEAAAQAYNEAASEAWGEYALLNAGKGVSEV